MSNLMESVKDFVQKNRKKIFITSGIFGGVYLIGRFAKGKLKELQETMALDQITRENIKKRYQRNQFDCLTTTANFLPILLEEISAAYNVEIITTRLQHTKNTNIRNNSEDQEDTERLQALEKKTKRELWEELKIMSFTRLIASVYIINLIALLTYLQINLIGRYVYIDSVITLNHNKNDTDSTTKSTKEKEFNPTETSQGLSTEIQAKYLAFSYYLIHVGWKELAERVKEETEKEIGPLLLNGKITFENLVEIVNKIRMNIEGTSEIPSKSRKYKDLNKNLYMTNYIINDEKIDNKILATVTNDDKVVIDEKLKNLLNETRDILESKDFSAVLSSCLNDSFDSLFMILKPTFVDTQNMDTESADTTNAPTKEILLAQMLPFITKSLYSVFYGVPNPFLEIIKDNMMQQRFSAIIYSSFEN
ncbi:Peroxin-3 [Anaeromyces robustus]|uniref:Peroxin-3 n=1 Tax=Anaeromyces robustus TaxID=1754192 RepID=A0A1Y1WY06_9FUNG|nr:Peroxin-3 [Anaeromyces robustus]|eukprot:ORX78447.1 Peroxin-3 [Anaeromyces robustus]